MDNTYYLSDADGGEPRHIRVGAAPNTAVGPADQKVDKAWALRVQAEQIVGERIRALNASVEAFQQDRDVSSREVFAAREAWAALVAKRRAKVESIIRAEDKLAQLERLAAYDIDVVQRDLALEELTARKEDLAQFGGDELTSTTDRYRRAEAAHKAASERFVAADRERDRLAKGKAQEVASLAAQLARDDIDGRA